MLILTRRVGEDIVIDDGKVVIKVLKVSATSSKVRLGITASPEVRVQKLTDDEEQEVSSK